jgi:KaiC/GvpD/RAD55 family RecA-like ATPase
MALKSGRELTQETVNTIKKFQSGELKPIATGINHLDSALLGGLTPGIVLGIVGRSSHGKSFDMERIQRHILKTQEDVLYVNCNWELSHFKLLLRDISQRTGDSIDKILFETPTEEAQEKLDTIFEDNKTDNVLYQNEPVNPEDFRIDIEKVIAEHPNKKIVVAIDNLENILISKGSQKESMDALLYQVNRLKNIHPYICFVVLNQMNQNYLLRMDNPKNQRPIDSDIYGSDQLYKLCDVLYVKLIPWKLGIHEKFMVFHKDMYSWLEDHKLHGNGNTASFDPYGRAFYFYLKLRAVRDEKNVQDIFIEQMFKKDSAEQNRTERVSTPSFNSTPIFEREKPVDEIVPPISFANLSQAFGSVENKDEPF